MSLRIGTNVASLAAQRHLSRGAEETSHALQALASGSRIVRASDDAAGYAISESLKGQASGLRQAKQNADNAAGLVQVAEGSLNEQNNILVRLRELAVQSASDTVSDDERGFMQTEFASLVSEVDRIANTTTFGQKKLLAGQDKQYEFVLGTSNDKDDVVSYKFDADTRASKLGVDSLGVGDKSDARGAMQSLDEAMLMVAQARSSFGAMQSRFEIAGNNIEVQRENILSARSRISDTDYAEETAKLVQAQVKQDYGIAVLSQANAIPAKALKLLA